MIIAEGWVRLAPGEIERVRAAAITMAQATRAEPGCLDYAFSQELGDPGLLRVIERWTDEAALGAHFATAHMQAFNVVLRGVTIETASVKAYAGVYQRTLVGD